MTRPTDPRQPSPEAWPRYLAAEAAGREDAAEAALAELFRGLPVLGPAAGFADRLMARIAPRHSWFSRPAARASLAAALVAAALSIAVVGPLVGPLAALIGPGGFLELLIGGFSALVGRFASGLAAWSPFVSAARGLGHVLSEPLLVALLGAQFLVSALALRGLAGLASPARSSIHAAS